MWSYDNFNKFPSRAMLVFFSFSSSCTSDEIQICRIIIMIVKQHIIMNNHCHSEMSPSTFISSLTYMSTISFCFTLSLETDDEFSWNSVPCNYWSKIHVPHVRNNDVIITFVSILKFRCSAIIEHGFRFL